MNLKIGHSQQYEIHHKHPSDEQKTLCGEDLFFVPQRLIAETDEGVTCEKCKVAAAQDKTIEQNPYGKPITEDFTTGGRTMPCSPQWLYPTEFIHHLHCAKCGKTTGHMRFDGEMMCLDCPTAPENQNDKADGLAWPDFDRDLRMKTNAIPPPVLPSFSGFNELRTTPLPENYRFCEMCGKETARLRPDGKVMCSGCWEVWNS